MQYRIAEGIVLEGLTGSGNGGQEGGKRDRVVFVDADVRICVLAAQYVYL